MFASLCRVVWGFVCSRWTGASTFLQLQQLRSDKRGGTEDPIGGRWPSPPRPSTPQVAAAALPAPGRRPPGSRATRDGAQSPTVRPVGPAVGACWPRGRRPRSIEDGKRKRQTTAVGRRRRARTAGARSPEPARVQRGASGRGATSTCAGGVLGSPLGRGSGSRRRAGPARASPGAAAHDARPRGAMSRDFRRGGRLKAPTALSYGPTPSGSRNSPVFSPSTPDFSGFRRIICGSAMSLASGSAFHWFCS
ncbi:uncharacterized protein AAES06_015367 [Glossophaga mutica]